MNTRDKIFFSIGSVALIAAAAVGGYVIFTPGGEQSSAPTIATNSISAQSSSVNTPLKDGTYTASANYSVPDGSNTITATIVVSGGKITSVTAKGTYADPESEAYLSSFESAVSRQAVGQSLATYQPSRIGGASLTTQGFASVLDSVRTDATS